MSRIEPLACVQCGAIPARMVQVGFGSSVSLCAAHEQRGASWTSTSPVQKSICWVRRRKGPDRRAMIAWVGGDFAFTYEAAGESETIPANELDFWSEPIQEPPA
jgi:hypothetical protein